ncbi:Short chain protein [Neofusicoccum parvum]|uniref:Short chain protein n=2 Tax=Neofusicoccum parvum TaxID=310453 RepID=A0ACB5SDS8_9PEZI|nr:putative short chain protein [Neofusicoccum parvum UCRNP2]GME36115.1 Short chain protein [Neofusicoccum parvum]GME40619.1 Short chain protein [Neofusicoccum parvum]
MAAQKVALITAGTAGLGAQIARVFAPDFRVVINYANNADRAQALLQELQSIPLAASVPAASAGTPRFHAIQADAGDKASVQNLVAETVKTMGRLDVVVSNVGWTRITNILNFDEGVVDEDWDKCFVYNVKTHMWLAYAAKQHLDETEGAFITTASVAGVKPSGSSLPYAVTKAAQIHLAKTLAVICAPKIRVNSVSPGLLMTEWGQKFPEAKIKKSIENTKLKRLATVEDVANQVRTLAISQSQTGQNFVIESGMTL